MADKSQLSAEAITSELDSLRQQIKSYAVQRAEGLIDSHLQRDLVSSLNARIAELEKSQTQADDSNEESSASPEPVDTQVFEEIANAQYIPSDTDKSTSDEAKPDDSDVVDHAESSFVKEVLEAESTDDEVEEKTHEHPEVPAVTDESDKAEHAEAQVIEEIIADDPPEDSNIIVEEEQHPIRREDDGMIQFGKFTDDIVVSSAMVKEPDYLSEIHEANVVDIRDITKTYKMGTFELEVLKGITLQVRQGEFISIMGPSGSGKSTLMNILGALDKPSSGEYFLDSVDVSKMNEKQLAEVRNSKIGFVFQSFNLLKRTTALRQVELPLIYGTHKDRTRRAREALEAVGLGQRIDHTPAELSGGQQQRVAIARAIVTEPSLILADEPTGNLDSRSGTEVMQIFQNMNRQNKITTIFVTHDPWIARHTDRVIMLRDGKIIADQRVKEPLVAGEAERPSEAHELQAIFENTYYGGDEEEYN